jgi:hypothetical protein
MAVTVSRAKELRFTLKLPGDLARLKFPKALDDRLQELLDRQDRTGDLTPAERQEAEGLVELAELLSLLKLRVDIASSQS